MTDTLREGNICSRSSIFEGFKDTCQFGKVKILQRFEDHFVGILVGWRHGKYNTRREIRRSREWEGV